MPAANPNHHADNPRATRPATAKGSAASGDIRRRTISMVAA